MEDSEFKFSEDTKTTIFYCGLDVHKHQLEVAVFGRDDSGHEILKGDVFHPDSRGMEAFWGFVKPYKPVKFAMEATNVYHHVVATFLANKESTADWKYEYLIVPPADAAGIPGRPKDDRIDARRLAVYLSAGVLQGGKPINIPIEDLRALFRAAYRLERDMTALKNRIKKSMDRGGFRPEKLNMNAGWVRDFLYQLTEHDGTIGEFYEACIGEASPLPKLKTLLSKHYAMFEPYLDIILSPGAKALVRQDIVELEFKTARKALLAVEIDRVLMTRPGLKQTVENIASIPGLSPYLAAWLVAEIGPIRYYENVRHFVSYCGVCRKTVKSANTVYSSHINRRSNKYIRTILFNAAKIVCIVLKKDSGLKTYANRVIARKGLSHPKLVWCIVAQKIARIIYGSIKANEPFFPAKACNAKKGSNDPGKVLTIADRKLLRKARNALQKVATIDKIKIIATRAKYFADALDEALREN